MACRVGSSFLPFPSFLTLFLFHIFSLSYFRWVFHAGSKFSWRNAPARKLSLPHWPKKIDRKKIKVKFIGTFTSFIYLPHDFHQCMLRNTCFLAPFIFLWQWDPFSVPQYIWERGKEGGKTRSLSCIEPLKSDEIEAIALVSRPSIRAPNASARKEGKTTRLWKRKREL